jgi:hypothetical protein
VWKMPELSTDGRAPVHWTAKVKKPALDSPFAPSNEPSATLSSGGRCLGLFRRRIPQGLTLPLKRLAERIKPLGRFEVVLGLAPGPLVAIQPGLRPQRLPAAGDTAQR